MANIYYVDPVNGSNDNDGLSTDAPLLDLWSENIDYGDNLDPSIFYIKRGTELVIPEDTDKTIQYAIVMSWPSSRDGEYYDNRPSDGTDWDDDDSPRANFKALNGSSITLPDTENNILVFKNIDLHFDDRDTDSFVILYNSKIGFHDCDINLPSWPSARDSSFILFKQATSDYIINDNVEVIRNNIYMGGGSFIGYYADDDLLYEKNITIDSSSITNCYRFIYADSNDNAGYKNTTLNIDNSNLELSNWFITLYGDNNSGDYAGRLYANIYNSSILASGGIYTGSTGYFTISVLELSIKNTRIALTDTSAAIVKTDHSGAVANYSNIEIYDSYINCKRLIYSTQANNYNATYSVTVSSTELVNMDYVFDFYRVKVDGITMSNNKYTNVLYVFYTHDNNYPFKNVIFNETDVILKKIGINLVTESNIRVSNSIINDVAFNYITHSNVVFTNCDTGPILGETHIEAYNTKFREVLSSPLSPTSLGYFENCIFINDDYPTISNSTFYNCEFTGAIDDVLNNNVSCTIYSSKIGTETVKFIKKDYGYDSYMAAPYRINGSEFSLVLDKKTNDFIPVENRNLFCYFDQTKPLLYLYFALPAALDYTKVKAQVLFKDIDGYKAAKMKIYVDPNSQWDGLTDDYSYYYAFINLSGYEIDNESKINFIITFPYDSIFKTYIDTLIGMQ